MSTPYAPPRRPSIQDDPYTPSTSAGRRDEISLLGLAASVVRHRWSAIWGALLLGALVGGLGLLGARTYTSAASFVPQPRRTGGSGGSSLAAQFGLSIAGSDPTQSPQFYVDLLTADEILRPLIDSPYVNPNPAGPGRATLIDIFAPGEGSKDVRAERAIRITKSTINASASYKTGVIGFSVSTRNPELSRQIADRLLTNLNEFNLKARIGQAATERKFIEARMTEAESQLRAAEDRAEEFIQSNREVGSSARLALERDRLQRDVNMRQQLFTALSMEYDRARNDELRDTPIIAILARPRAAILPDPRGIVKKTFLAAMFGAALGLIIAMMRDYFRDNSESHPFNSRSGVRTSTR